MMVDLASLMGLFDTYWVLLVGVFLRVGAVIFLAPGFGERVLPMRVRLGLAFAYTAIVLPTVSPPPTGSPYVMAAAEVTAGLFLGIALRATIFALQTAGSIAAQSTSLAQMFGGVDGEPAAAYGHLVTMLGIAVALSLGLHLRLADYLIASYQLLPAGVPVSGAGLAKQALALLGGSFAMGFRLALPFVVGAFLYNLTLGLMNRAMPQLMVVFIGAPVLTFGGLVLMYLVTPLLIHAWAASMAGVLDGQFDGLR